MSKVFISYRRADPDQRLAAFLQQHLASRGLDVFRDVNTPIGARWAVEIEQHLDAADFFIILISDQSMDRDMVREEVKRVYARQKQHGKPAILPVRLAYTGALPYEMSAWLDPLQYALWNDERDNESIVEQLTKAIGGGTALPHTSTTTTEDRKAFIRDMESSGRPLPRAEPSLEVLGLTPDSPFYVTREVDADFCQTLAFDQGVATLHAPRQMGKSSLFARLHKPLTDAGLAPVFIDFKLLASEELPDARAAFKALAGEIGQQFNLAADPDSFFTGKGFATSQFQKFLTTAVAGAAERGVALLFDDVDSVFEKPYRNGLFGGLRTIIDQKPYSEPLRRIKFGFAHSYDPTHWIQDRAQSPFNVAKVYVVPEFSEAQVRWLNEQHGMCIEPACLAKMIEFLGGHPFLTRVALYWFARREITVEKLKAETATDQGIFGDHLRSRLWAVFQGGLNTALKQIIDTGHCEKEMDFQSLLAMGLVKGRNHCQAAARFGLYQDYFQGRLDA